MSKTNTRATIDANIKQNGQQLISGQILNSVLNTIVTDYAEEEKVTELERKVDNFQALENTSEDGLFVCDPSGYYIAKISQDEVALLPKAINADSVRISTPIRVSNPIGDLNMGESVSGLSLNQFVERIISKPSNIFSFYHISDPHRALYSIDYLNEVMSDDDFAVITGDLQFNSSMIAETIGSGKEWMVIAGNHDFNDTAGGDVTYLREQMIVPLNQNSAVVWGSEDGCYWHEDKYLGGRMVRFFGFDEYQGAFIRYSPEQVRWFISLLRNMPSNAYFICLHHCPVAAKRVGSGPIGETAKFTSEKAPSYYEYTPATNKDSNEVGHAYASLIPMIVDAYLNKGVINGTYYIGPNADDYIILNENFSDVEPSTFIAHLCGHTHWDVVEHLPLYPSQLQIVIDRDQAQYRFSDLPRNSADEETMRCINKYSIDFEERTIRIDRLGAHITDNGNNRDNLKISF